jgi:hypothetical protein
VGFELVDLRDYPLPFFGEPKSPRVGVAEPTASLAAEAGVAAFKVGFERWVDDRCLADYWTVTWWLTWYTVKLQGEERPSLGV